EVRPLGPGERFRAITDDAQVEVRGTSFDLAVRTGHLEAVRVWHGRVEVRPQHAAATLLGAGDGWVPAVASIVSAPAASRGAIANPANAVPSRRILPVGTPPTPREAPVASTSGDLADGTAAPAAERWFARGWAELHAGEPARAALAFAEAARAAGSNSLAEDARFWCAVAWTRANRNRQARQAPVA